MLFLVCFSVNSQTVTETFGSGANQFAIDFVQILDPGNAPNSSGIGSVAYKYNIGKYEVSRDMVLKASTAGGLGLTLEDMSSYGGNRGSIPATGISWSEAAKFVNWLNTSKGYQAAYLFDGSGNFQMWSSVRGSVNNLFRHKDAYYFLPSVDEWYKSAYGSPSGNWYSYPTGSNVAPSSTGGGTNANTAVFNNGRPADITDAGGLSAWGTMAQGGNVMEWLETAYDGINDTAGETRAARGGYFDTFQATGLGSLQTSMSYSMSTESFSLGFRVASVPEPSALSLLAVGLGGLAVMRRRRS